VRVSVRRWWLCLSRCDGNGVGELCPSSGLMDIIDPIGVGIHHVFIAVVEEGSDDLISKQLSEFVRDREVMIGEARSVDRSISRIPFVRLVRCTDVFPMR
jgi:hypothetical protein